MNLEKRLGVFRGTSWADVLVLIVVSLCTLFFVCTSFESAIYIKDYTTALTVFAAVFAAVGALWAALVLAAPREQARRYARIAMSPFLILVLLIPYNYFYNLPNGIRPVLALILVTVGAVGFLKILSAPDAGSGRRDISLGTMIVLACCCALVFGTLAVRRHLNFQDTSSFDVAIYNQIQWNNIHGRFYQSSISGNNFVTHNSPFWILISPLYAIYPHPGTLLFIKSIFLASALVPFYLLLRQLRLPAPVMAPLVVSYIFYPFLVGQYFNAPHEMCFLPTFLFFALYFFLRERFWAFMLFLMICLSIKEHLAMVAVMFGLYALWLRRPRRWILAPCGLGFFWAGFSLWIMHYFQQRYTVDPYPAWLIDNIKGRFLQPGNSVAENLAGGLQTAVLGQSHSLIFVYTLFAALGLIFPLLSPLSLLGLPEFAINLLASIALFFPTWHYNIVVGCFLLAGCAQALVRIPGYLPARLPAVKTQQLCAGFICLSVLSHSFLWLDYLHIQRDPDYLRAMQEAIAKIPNDASVTAPKHLAAHISTRDDYFLIDDPRRGDYILIDRGKTISNPVPSDQGDLFYQLIFERGGVRLYHRTGAP